MDTSPREVVKECPPPVPLVCRPAEQPLAFPADFSVGEWMVEPSLGRVSRRGTVIRLRPQLMDVLVCLASGDGRTVMKKFVFESVWGDRFVSESSLPRTVAELRQAFGDDARQPRIIETIPKRGYRIIAPIVRGTTGPAVFTGIAVPARGEDGERALVDADPASADRPMFDSELSPGFLGLIVGLFVVAGAALLVFI
jgi:DNA-binding winged helix-turn-helix (wHTH) protein